MRIFGLRVLTFVLIFFIYINIVFAKKKDNLNEKVQSLVDMANKKPIIRLTGTKFRELVRNQPRNYSVIVMFTALNARRKCVICEQAKDEYILVSNSYKSSAVYSNKLFLALADFDEASDAFQIMNINSAPVFMHFPEKGKPLPADTMDLQRFGVDAGAIANWIVDRTGIDMKFSRPPSFVTSTAIPIMTVMMMCLLYLRRNNLEFLYNKTMWATLTVFYTTLMLSGQMWNQIRGPPLYHHGQDGSVGFISGSSQGQFVLESYFIAVIYGLMCFGMIILTHAASDLKGDVSKRKVFIFIGIGLFTFFFSLMLSIFRSKSGGYPYSFLI